MKLKLLLMFGLMLAGKSLTASPIGTYGLHLFFNEASYVDVVKISYVRGLYFGNMHVPNDFDAPLDNIKVDHENNTIEFTVKVPKNRSRPKDLIFHYKGQYFNKDAEQMIGFVTLKDSEDFVASFTAFKREQDDSSSK